jgi:hypothetical protein
MISTDKKPFEFNKQPSEKEIVAVDFSRRIPQAVSILDVEGLPGTGYSVVPSVYEKNAEVQGDSFTLIVSDLSISRKVLSCMVSSGTDKIVYKCTFIITLSDGQVKEEDVFIRVNEV